MTAKEKELLELTKLMLEPVVESTSVLCRLDMCGGQGGTGGGTITSVLGVRG